MYNGIDILIEAECISEHKVLKGLLTKGDTYIVTKKLNIGDFKIQKDDRGKSNFYRCEYFKVTKIIDCNYDIFVGDVIR